MQQSTSESDPTTPDPTTSDPKRAWDAPRPADLSRWWAWAAPLSVIAVLMVFLAAFAAAGDAWKRSWAYRPWVAVFEKEAALEWLSVLVLLVAASWAVVAFARRSALPRPVAGWLFLGYAALCVFIAGEEASWGQHALHWQTPETLAAVNDQNETNLHNIGNALDLYPRYLFNALIAFACVFAPLWHRFKGFRYDPARSMEYWVWPTAVTLPAAALALLTPWPHRVARWTLGHEPPQWLRISEVHEFFLALVLMFYITSIAIRLKGMPQLRAAAASDAAAPPTASPVHPPH